MSTILANACVVTMNPARDILDGASVLVRGDLNVPVQDGKVTDTTRIDRLAPTVRELVSKKASATDLTPEIVLDLAPDLPKQVMDDVYLGLNAEEREQLRAAGKAPLLKEQPGYRSGLDADHDGVACQ